jgi:hypothetical protein
VLHPMQYELERAYHATCEANAARHRQVIQAEHPLGDEEGIRGSVLGIGLQLRLRFMPALRASVAELGRVRLAP